MGSLTSLLSSSLVFYAIVVTYMTWGLPSRKEVFPINVLALFIYIISYEQLCEVCLRASLWVLDLGFFLILGKLQWRQLCTNSFFWFVLSLSNCIHTPCSWSLAYKEDQSCFNAEILMPFRLTQALMLVLRAFLRGSILLRQFMGLPWLLFLRLPGLYFRHAYFPEHD